MSRLQRWLVLIWRAGKKMTVDGRPLNPLFTNASISFDVWSISSKSFKFVDDTVGAFAVKNDPTVRTSEDTERSSVVTRCL